MDTGISWGVGSNLPSMRLLIKDGRKPPVAYDFSTGWTSITCEVAPLARPTVTLATVSTITVTGTASTDDDDANIELTPSVTNLAQIVEAYEAAYGSLTEPTAMVAIITATRSSDSLPMILSRDDLPVFKLMPTIT